MAGAREKPASVYHYYKRLIALRHRREVLVYGSYELLGPDHPAVYAYRRTLGDETIIVSLHFGAEDIAYRVGEATPDASTRLVGNDQSVNKSSNSVSAHR